MIGVLSLSSYVIRFANEKGKQITHLKLQKILYLIQCAYLYEFGKLLFTEEFEVWEYGPVLRNVYVEYCNNGALPLYETEDALRIGNYLNEKEKRLIDIMIDICLDKTCRELILITLNNEPCASHKKDAINGLKPKISNSEMIMYFRYIPTDFKKSN